MLEAGVHVNQQWKGYSNKGLSYLVLVTNPEMMVVQDTIVIIPFKQMISI